MNDFMKIEHRALTAKVVSFCKDVCITHSWNKFHLLNKNRSCIDKHADHLAESQKIATKQCCRTENFFTHPLELTAGFKKHLSILQPVRSSINTRNTTKNATLAKEKPLSTLDSTA